ncbi:SDR family NAD(P)-dependent oxidoreductase [Flavobacteriaceae bacterium]|nr:SDR family NAD(P)-dependent oxidoreductase [Flavobacteriaceae bacterium]
MPEDRWNIEKFYDPNPNKKGKIKSKKGGFIESMKKFDAEFFNIFPKVAKSLDPRQKHLLETVYESLEDAGLTLEQVNGSRTAVMMGVFLGDEGKKIAGSDLETINSHSAMGGADTTVSARVAYQFNLKGPTLSVDTACSSSLVAVQLACNAIWIGDAKMAIAGGVNIMTSHEHSLQLSQGGFLSPDGLCKSFDASANGYVRGEGAGAIIIKPLEDARKDGDEIYAVIRNAVVNSDGHTSDGITVPNEFAQIEMLKKAYGDVGIKPKDVDFIEAHGTGTSLGDPKETFAFGNVFSEGRNKDNPLIIGSVKSNIGHTEAVAGIAGLIKLALSIRHQQIPQNLHFKNPNPAIKFDEWKLKVPTELMNWPQIENKKMIGGVNSFGAGGTNAHVVLEQYIPHDKKDSNIKKQHNFPYLFTLSAKNKASLKDLCQKYIDFISSSNTSLNDICFSLLKKRSNLPEKLVITAVSKDDILSSLSSYVKSANQANLIHGVTNRKPKIAFICSGQGPQWYAMGRQLLKNSKVFTDIIQKIDLIFQELSGYSILKEMNKSAADSRIGETKIAQPAIMAVQIGLIEMYRSFGIEAEGVSGHSIGEVAAAYASKALSLRQAVEVIYNRSKEQDRASGAGKMLAIGTDYENALGIIDAFSKQVSIAAINGPEMVVLSGDVEPLEKIAQNLEKAEIFNKFLAVNVPFHSHHMEPIKQDMLDGLKNLQPSKAEIALYSTVTGRKEDGLHLDSKYWYDNVRQTVYFTSAIEAMISDDFDCFIEIAPHPVLGGGINDLLLQNKKEGNVISSLSRKIKDFEAGAEYESKDFLGAIAKMHILGCKINFDPILSENSKFIKLPHYAWQHQEYWLESKAHEESRLKKPSHPFIKSCNKNLSNNLGSWELNLDQNSETFLTDHKIGGTIVFPGAAQLEIAHEIGQKHYGENFSHLENIQFPLALFLPDDDSITEAKLEISSIAGNYKIFSQHENNNQWNHNGFGKMCHLGENFNSLAEPLKALKSRLITKKNQISVDDFYSKLDGYGLNYGAHFRLVKEMWRDGDEILAKIEIHADDITAMKKYHIIPSLSDACLHIVLHGPEDGLYLPHIFGKYNLYQKTKSKTVWSHAKILNCDNQFLDSQITSYDRNGKKIFEVQDFRLKYLENSRQNSDDPYDGIYEHQWIESSLDVKTQEQKNVLLFADSRISATLLPKLKASNEVILVQKAANFQDNKTEYSLNPNSKEDFQNLFQAIDNNGQVIDKIVNLWALDIKFTEDSDSTEFSEQSKNLIQPNLYLLQEVAKMPYDARSYFVTNGADVVDEADKNINFLQGSLYGMGRVFTNEYPSMPLTMIDVSYQESASEIEALYQEIIAQETKIHQSEIAFRHDNRFARQLVKVDQEDAESRMISEADAMATEFQINVGNSNKLSFIASEVNKIADDQLVINVQYYNLNPQDLLKKKPLANYQIAGNVKSIGAKVKNFKIGDEVLALVSSESISSTVVLTQNNIVKKPQNLSLHQSSAILLPYVIAYCALQKTANIKAGDFVLIEKADSAIGLAMTHMVKLAKAKVIAIVDDVKNRDLIEHIGDIFILNNKADFISEIANITANKGLDMIINFNQREGFFKTLSLLNPFSAVISFMDQSHEQDQINFPLNLQTISLNLINIEDIICLQKEGVLNKIIDIIENNNFNFKQESLCQMPDLNKFFRKSDNKKLTNLTIEKSGNIDLLPIQEQKFCSDSTYLITGGASGLGLALVEWMIEKGAKHFALVSRNGPKNDADKKTIADWQKSGVTISWQEVKADVAKQGDVERVIDYIKQNMPPLKGVIHSAGILADATYPNIDMARFKQVYDPKVMGAWNLHHATKGLDLDLFLMISSVSSIVGIAGQANYAAANSFLNHLALYRKNKGLVANSACLGLLSGEFAGMSENDEEVVEMVYRIVGTKIISKKSLFSKSEKSILSKSSYLMLSPMNWSNFTRSYQNKVSNFIYSKIFKEELKEKNQQHRSKIKNIILSQNISEKITTIKTALISALADILGLSTKAIDTTKPITNIGLDSLMLNQFRNWIQSNLEINLPLVKLAKGPSLTELSIMILDIMDSNTESNIKTDDVSGIANDNDLKIFARKWLIKSKINEEAKIKIFCLHPVGAGASMFSHFMFNSPQDSEITAIQLPGRENRLAEPHYQDMKNLVPDLAEAILSHIDRNVIFWGHSWGGVVLYEVIKYLRINHFTKYQLIKQLMVTGSIAPQLTVPWKDRDSIKETAKQHNSIDKILSTVSYIDDEKFLRKIIPIMKKDMATIMTYQYQAEAKLDMPILAFGAKEDDVVLLSELEKWQEQTNNNFTLHALHGDHWFLSRNKEFILEQLAVSIENILSPNILKEPLSNLTF